MKGYKFVKLTELIEASRYLLSRMRQQCIKGEANGSSGNDFTVNLAIVVIVVFFALAMVGGEDK